MITGLTLKNSIISGANNLSNRRAKVDELNVFPVPDRDTRTNMGITIAAARTELPNLPDDWPVETAAQVIDTTSKRKGLVNAATIAHMIAMPKKIHAIFPAIYILPFHEKQFNH